MFWGWLMAQGALKTSGALLVGETALRRGLAAALLGMAIVLPFLSPLSPLQVVLLSFVAIVAAIKVTQIASSGKDWSMRRRLWHLFGIVDTRGARRVRPALKLRSLGLVVLNGALLFAALVGLAKIGELSGLAYRIAWTLCTATVACAGFEVFSRLVHIVYLAVGVETPPVQRNPVVSRSLAEFWGQRWNSVVGGWLREFVFTPLARKRHPRLGLAASFGASGALHAWLLLGLGVGAALQMAAYFVVQGAAFFAESGFGLRRAPVLVGRLWTIAVLLVPLPLLFEPWLDAIDREFVQAASEAPWTALARLNSAARALSYGSPG